MLPCACLMCKFVTFLTMQLGNLTVYKGQNFFLQTALYVIPQQTKDRNYIITLPSTMTGKKNIYKSIRDSIQ